jgi:glutamate formiminotransferase
VCAANVSEGRDGTVLDALRDAASDALLDVHVDVDHHRSVLTMAGPPEDLVSRVLAVGAVALATIDLRRHAGVHPRLGSLDVVPFAPLEGVSLEGALAAREAAIDGLGAMGIPVFRFGPDGVGGVRSLPELRRGAFHAISPDAGPAARHRTAGATAVGARLPLVAWNLWLQGISLAATRALAALVRGPSVRALGFEVTGATQVSCNLLDAAVVTPLDVYRLMEGALDPTGHVVRCELVGLVPVAVLRAVPEGWWARLDLSVDRAVETRAAAAGLSER